MPSDRITRSLIRNREASAAVHRAIAAKHEAAAQALRDTLPADNEQQPRQPQSRVRIHLRDS